MYCASGRYSGKFVNYKDLKLFCNDMKEAHGCNRRGWVGDLKRFWLSMRGHELYDDEL